MAISHNARSLLDFPEFAQAVRYGVPGTPQRRLAAASHEPEEQRDLGMICLQLDHPGEAIDPLEAYLTALPDADDAEPVTGLLNAARRQVARWN